MLAKLIFSVLTILSSGYVGIKINNEYSKKLEFFVTFKAFLQYILVKIAFFQNKFSDCVLSFVETHKTNSDFFEKLCELSKSSKLNVEKVSEIIDTDISDKEKEMVAQFLVAISTSNISNVEKAINGCISEIELNINKYQEQKKTKGELAKKLSICVGLVICILLY